MSFNKKLFITRNALMETITKDVGVPSEEVVACLDGQSIRSLSTELAWTIASCTKRRCSVELVIYRIAFIFAHVKQLHSGNFLKSFYMKMISVVNETCSVMLECDVDPKVCMQLVSTFMNKVNCYNGTPLNSILKMMSHLLIPTENTAQKRAHSNMKNSKANMLLREGILTMEIDTDDANESFLASPGLKVNFISVYRTLELETELDSGFAFKVRTMLGMDTDGLQGGLGEFPEVDVSSHALNAFLNSGPECTLEELVDHLLPPQEAIPHPTATPESIGKKRTYEEPEQSTPPRKRSTPTTKTRRVVQAFLKPAAFAFEKLRPEKNTMVSYFKIQRGTVTHRHHIEKPKLNRATISDVLFCDEPPLAVDDM